ncbi:unnamed protein product [Rotaria magnacalcarata]|uniref:Uncharacterized protein n=1 Tax=Rotaria magnacalcarata TaxID=392030 RepID=A0A816VIX5_9BILA|nr:unnamed protein product [Rotaria magnacalcarata]CAF3884125.1 unnamed protein product [Rotaria magnacalcarata]
MELFDKAEEYYQRCLIPPLVENKQNHNLIYKKLAILAERRPRNLAETHRKTATDFFINANSHLESYKVDILHKLNDQIFNKNNFFDVHQLFSHFQAFFSKDLDTFGYDCLCTTKNYETLSVLLPIQGNLEQVLDHNYNCLDIEVKLLPNNHPKLAKTYEVIGDLNLLTNTQHQALISYQNKIQISSR